jgi:hypothetical protein
MVVQRPQWKRNAYRWAVICRNPDCHFVNDGHKTEAEARAAWNRRASEAAAQWTSETPTENGMFAFVSSNSQHFGLAFKGDNIVVFNKNGYEISLFVERFKPQWYKIPEPPIPAEREATK